jgi:ribosomal protein S18 acetylase RimI-like enzyme
MENKRIYMVRKSVKNIPRYDLPEAFKVKWYKPGYEKYWYEIHDKSEKHVELTPDLFDEQFKKDVPSLEKRQFYIFDSNDLAVGTSTAWFNENYNGQPYGQIHWVAIIPEMQGKGLAKPLLSILCNRLIELGHTRIFLITESLRLPAINLYYKFGFVPDIKSKDDEEVWKGIDAGLNR